LACLLLIRTWYLYSAVKNISGSGNNAGDGSGSFFYDGSSVGVSGQGSAVRCFHLMIKAPTAANAANAANAASAASAANAASAASAANAATPSFVVMAESTGGQALRDALESGAVRYCSTGGYVYSARRTVDFDDGAAGGYGLQLSPPDRPCDPSEFPTGSAATSAYAWTRQQTSAPVAAYMMFF
jgi:hypothetical protein